MSAAHAHKDDWTQAAQPEPPRDRPRLYLAYSRSEEPNDETSNTPNGDTRTKGQSLDFGYGWSVDQPDCPVQPSKPPLLT